MTPPVGRRREFHISARVFGAPLPLPHLHDFEEWHGEGRVGRRLRAVRTGVLGCQPEFSYGSRKMLQGPGREGEACDRKLKSAQ